MIKQIWKFSTGAHYMFRYNYFTIKMPAGAEILTVQLDGKDESPCIWALVDPETMEEEERYFEFYETGHNIHYDMGVERKYIGTYQYPGGQFAGHIFERIN